MAFQGFPQEGISFLKRLKRNNDRDWFKPRKEEYEELVRDPMLDLVNALAVRFHKIAPEIRFGPRSVLRIYRDTRFSKDKTPYKTHIGASFDMQGQKGMSAPGFYLHVAPEEVFAAGGLYMPDARQLSRLRYAIDQNPEALHALLDARKFRSRFGGLKGEVLKRAPKGYQPEHPEIDLLRHKQFFVSQTFDPKECQQAAFARKVGESFEAMLPLVRWLRDHSR